MAEFEFLSASCALVSQAIAGRMLTWQKVVTRPPLRHPMLGT